MINNFSLSGKVIEANLGNSQDGSLTIFSIKLEHHTYYPPNSYSSQPTSKSQVFRISFFGDKANFYNSCVFPGMFVVISGVLSSSTRIDNNGIERINPSIVGREIVYIGTSSRELFEFNQDNIKRFIGGGYAPSQATQNQPVNYQPQQPAPPVYQQQSHQQVYQPSPMPPPPVYQQPLPNGAPRPPTQGAHQAQPDDNSNG